MVSLRVVAIVAILISDFHLTIGNFHLGVIEPQANESMEANDNAMFNNSVERKIKENLPLATAKTKIGIVSHVMNNDGDNKVMKVEGRNSRCRFRKRFLERRQGTSPKKVINSAKYDKNGQSRMLDSILQKRQKKGLPNAKDFSVMNSDDASDEKYYYYDFSPLMNSQTEHMLRINDMNIPDPYLMRFENARSMAVQPRHRPVIDNNSCKQYLEFLKYAFQQLDSSSTRSPNDFHDYDYHYENPYDYDQIQGKFPASTVQKISANMGLLNSLAYSEGNFSSEAMQGINPQSEVHTTSLNRQQITDKDVTTEAIKLSNFNRSNPSSVTAPWTPLTNALTRKFRILSPIKTVSNLQPGSTLVTPDAIKRVTFDHERRTTSAMSTTHHKNTDETQSVHVGISTKKSEKFDTKQSDSSDCNEKMFPCPDNFNVTYPINGYCNRFVACESGKPHPEFCQEGLHFNLITKQCDLPHNSFCTYSCPQEKGFYGVPGDCGGFFRCQNWYPEYRTCPPRMHWDLKAKICTFQELSSCPLKCDTPFEVKSYNGICNAYIICTRSIPQYHKCPDGTIFDRKKLKCLPKRDTDCVNDEDYITRNRGIENGLKKLCADIEIKDGVSRWCQEPTNID